MREQPAGRDERAEEARLLLGHVPEVAHHGAARTDLLRHLRAVRDLAQERRLGALERFEDNRRAALRGLLGEAAARVLHEVLAQLLEAHLGLAARGADDEANALHLAEHFQNGHEPRDLGVVLRLVEPVELGAAARRREEELAVLERFGDLEALVAQPAEVGRHLHGLVAVRFQIVEFGIDVVRDRDTPPLQAEVQLGGLRRRRQLRQRAARTRFATRGRQRRDEPRNGTGGQKFTSIHVMLFPFRG